MINTGHGWSICTGEKWSGSSAFAVYEQSHGQKNSGVKSLPHKFTVGVKTDSLK